MRFQDTIYGRQLAADGKARRRAHGLEIIKLVRELYANHVYIASALDFAFSEGLITECEKSDAWSALLSMTKEEFAQYRQGK